MSSKFSQVVSRLKERKTVEEGKEITLEKGDMKALILVAFEIFAPVLLGCLAFFAAVIFVLMQIWG